MSEFRCMEDGDPELKLKQIPSAVNSQDVSHILTTIFKDLLSNNSFNTEIIENQVNAQGSDDPYHKRYVSEMQKLFTEREERVAHINNLEHYIIQAQARALSADERNYNKYRSVGINKDISTPNAHFRLPSVTEMKMLRSNGLITQDDYTTEKKIPVPPPDAFCKAPRRRSMYSSKQSQKTMNGDQKLENQSILTFSNSDNSVKTTSVKQTPQKDDLVFPSSNAWKEYPSLEERIKEKSVMAKMEAKANYLRNPRHQDLSLISGMTSLIHQKKSPTETNISLQTDNNGESPIFLPIPKEIVFKEYKTGNIYEVTLELKNITTVLRSCRVLPPASKYFTLGLGQFPGEHGLVAPGMSCLYTIQFAPDSLNDFVDELKIITQSSNSISVPLLGKRPHPILSLPPVIDLGYCLVSSISVIQVLLKNSGGPGCFCLLPTSSWPATNFRTVVREETINIQPFMIRPSTFEMKSGQIGVLEFAFKPKETKYYKENVTIICDNCQVKNFSIIGIAQQAEVAILPSTDVYTEPATEDPEKPEKHCINFGNANQFAYQEKHFTVKNCTNVSLPFYWVKYKITVDPTNPEGTVNYSKVMAGTPPFCVYPTYGVLPPVESINFETVFAPEKVDSYRCVLQMILENVPNTPGTNEENNFIKNDDIFGGKLEIDHKNQFVSLSIELQAQCIPFSVMLMPYAMFIHGQIYTGITEKRGFSFINNSISHVKFSWELYESEFFTMEVEPSTGTIDSNTEMQLQLCVTGYRPGLINHRLKCYLEYQEEPINFNIQADVKGADIVIEEPNVDFGLICQGECPTREITLHNKSPIPTDFVVQETTKSDSGLSELKIYPENGNLQPFETCKLYITYNAENIILFTKYISVKVVDGEESTILITGEVQVPHVVLKSCELHMERLYHNVPGTYYVVLINNTILPAFFEWQQAFGSQSTFCDIQMIPQSGYIGPREEQEVEITFVAYKRVLFHDIYIRCQVQGMETHPCLSLTGDVLGVDVKYKISQENSLLPGMSYELEKIDFGESVSINSLSHVYIHIFNNSAIETSFNAYIEHFPARLPSLPTPEEMCKNFHSRRHSVWQRSHTLQSPGAFLTSIDKDLKKSYLNDNNGAAFLINPTKGQLPAYDSVVIQISAINNMWGEYSDIFCCQVADLEVAKFPVQLNVIGSPLKFLMVNPNTDQVPKLRFGSHVAGNDSTDRKLRISNTSPFDIRVDWLGYNIYNDDDKLLDFKVIYGDAFPILGNDGSELVPSPPESPLQQSPPVAPSEKQDKQDEENEAIIDTDNFIKTVFDMHSGDQSDKPFTIIPKQMIIPANSHATVLVRLSPPPAQEVIEELKCISFGLGYLNLCDRQKNDKSSRISRPQAYNTRPLTIHMTADILPAQLYVDFMGEDKLSFKAGLGELLENNKLCVKKMKMSSLKIINQTQTAMNFDLMSKHPFTFINLQRQYSSSSDKTNEKYSNSYTLNPQKHLMVKVGFILTSDILNYRQKLDDDDDACLLDGISLKTVGKETWMVFNTALTIQFKNEMTQIITAEANVALPDFEVSTDEIDFGTCWIGQEQYEEFTLRNTSQSKTLFIINTEALCSCCDSSVFQVESSSGYLEGHVMHTDAFWTKIKIIFAVKKVGGHQAELTIKGIMGEKKLTINLRGYGSHDGRHCSVIEG